MYKIINSIFLIVFMSCMCCIASAEIARTEVIRDATGATAEVARMRYTGATIDYDYPGSWMMIGDHLGGANHYSDGITKFDIPDEILPSYTINSVTLEGYFHAAGSWDGGDMYFTLSKYTTDNSSIPITLADTIEGGTSVVYATTLAFSGEKKYQFNDAALTAAVTADIAAGYDYTGYVWQASAPDGTILWNGSEPHVDFPEVSGIYQLGFCGWEWGANLDSPALVIDYTINSGDPVTLSVHSSGAASVGIGSSTGHEGTTDYTKTITDSDTVNLLAPQYVGSGTYRKSFTGWTGSAGSSSTASFGFAMNGDMTITVNYVDDPGPVTSSECFGVSFGDLATLASKWLDNDCDLPDWCVGTDLDQSGNVDFVDYAIAFCPVEPLILVDNGTCNVSIHNIAVGGPSTVETYAAEELQAAFQLACGVTPPINPSIPAAIKINLGEARRFNPGVGNSSEQAYAVRRTTDDNIELIGNSPAGVMWAVDDFCKEVLHVSWPVTTNVMMLEGAPQSTVAIERLCVVQAPDFEVRGWIIGVNTDGYHYDDTIGKWMAHNRQNNVHNRMDHMDEGGGYDKMLSRGITVDTTMHTYGWIVPPDLYDEHPEYFPFINGERKRPGRHDIHVQRCISNPDVFDLAASKAVWGFNQYPDVKVFGVGQNDGGGWCECTSATPPYTGDCQGWDGAQAGTGVYSNRITHFVNLLADYLGPYYPGKYIGTFAYGAGRQAPDIAISDNVSVTFVTAGGNYMKKFTDPTDPANAAEMAVLSGWLAKSDNVHFWTHHWTTSMGSCLTPYSRTVIEGFSDLKALGLKGFSGETRTPYWVSQRLFFYAVARASWDTSLDYDEILDDYCNEAYGPAGADMKLFHLLYENRIYENIPVLTRDAAAAQLFPPLFSSADMDTLEGYLTDAETAAAAGGFQGNIDAVDEVREMFDNFKAISIDPVTIAGIGPNLIINPGAEAGQGPWLWDVLFGTGDYSFTIPTGGAHSGNKSLKIEFAGPDSGFARWYQNPGAVLTPGKKYAASFWIRADDNASGIVEFYMPALTQIGWQDSDDEWVQIVIPELTATGTGFGIYPSMAGQGYVYFDDLFIGELP